MQKNIFSFLFFSSLVIGIFIPSKTVGSILAGVSTFIGEKPPTEKVKQG